jgi:hypothetical protein
MDWAKVRAILRLKHQFTHGLMSRFQKHFRRKNVDTTLAGFTYNLDKVIIILVFKKNNIFLAEDCPKSRKFVIITMTPGSRLLGRGEDPRFVPPFFYVQ